MAKRSSPRLASSRCCSGACALTSRGLRAPTAVADRPEAQAARARRRRQRPQGQADRSLGNPPEDAPSRTPARRAGTGVLRAGSPRLAGVGTEKEGSGRERDTGARIIKALEGQRRAAGSRAPNACSLTRHRLAPSHNLTLLTDVDHRDDNDARANTGQRRADQDPAQPNRPHRRRSATRREASATDPPSEIGPNSARNVRQPPLIFIGRPQQQRSPAPSGHLLLSSIR